MQQLNIAPAVAIIAQRRLHRIALQATFRRVPTLRLHKTATLTCRRRSRLPLHLIVPVVVHQSRLQRRRRLNQRAIATTTIRKPTSITTRATTSLKATAAPAHQTETTRRQNRATTATSIMTTARNRAVRSISLTTTPVTSRAVRSISLMVRHRSRATTMVTQAITTIAHHLRDITHTMTTSVMTITHHVRVAVIGVLLLTTIATTGRVRCLHLHR